MKTYVEILRKELLSVIRDLDAMGRHQAGTEWHLDRVDQARWLVSEIERLTGPQDLALVAAGKRRWLVSEIERVTGR